MPFGCDGAMKRSKSLFITATNPIADDQEAFTVSLEGFATTMNRVAELAKSSYGQTIGRNRGGDSYIGEAIH